MCRFEVAPHFPPPAAEKHNVRRKRHYGAGDDVCWGDQKGFLRKKQMEKKERQHSIGLLLTWFVELPQMF